MGDYFSSENIKVQEIMRKYFTPEKWKAVPEAIQSRHLNMCRHYVEGKF